MIASIFKYMLLLTVSIVPLGCRAELLRGYSAPASTDSTARLVASIPDTVNTVVAEAPKPAQPELDAEHSDAINDALMPAMGLPGPVNHALNCFLVSLGNSDLTIIAKYAKGDCGIEVIDLLFDYSGVVKIPEARLLILSLVEGLVDDINSDTKLKKFFKTYPISSDNVAIRIRVNPPNCGLSYPALGNIATISALDGVIAYGTLNSFTREIDCLRTESYEKAEAIASR